MRALNERGFKRPRSRQLVWQKLAPLMEGAGDLKHFVGEGEDGPRNIGNYMPAAALERWVRYIRFREERVEAGEWGVRRPYSIEEMWEVERMHRESGGA